MVNRSSDSTQNGEEKIAISRAEICLLVLLLLAGMGTSVWVDREMPVLLKDREPREEQINSRFHIAAQQAEVLMDENERKAIEDQLIKARLEETTQRSTAAALAAAFPELTNSAAAPKAISIPTEISQSYRDAHIKELIATRLVQSLSNRLDIVKNQATQASTNLEQSQHSARTEFRQSHGFYMLVRRVLTFVASLLIVSVLILIVRVVTSPRRRFAVRRGLTFPLTVGALFVLFAYQSFELAGAALVGVVVLLVLFARYIPWPTKIVPTAIQPDTEPEKGK